VTTTYSGLWWPTLLAGLGIGMTFSTPSGRMGRVPTTFRPLFLVSDVIAVCPFLRSAAVALSFH